MKRFLLNALTALSLLLCVAVVALWVRSYRVGDVFEKSRPEVYCSIESRPGEVWTRTDWTKLFAFVEDSGYGGWQYRAETPPPPALSQHLRTNGTPPEWRCFAGFLFRRQEDATDDVPSSVIGVPLWAPAVVFAVLPMVWLYRRMRPNHPPGHFRRCGYDLRASSMRCPECGSMAPDLDAP